MAASSRAERFVAEDVGKHGDDIPAQEEMGAVRRDVDAPVSGDLPSFENAAENCLAIPPPGTNLGV